MRLSGGALVTLLTALTSTGALSIAMYTPALPALTVDLGSDPNRAKLTLTLFLAAFAVAQLIYGPLSDAYGRRVALLSGLSLFTLGSIACAMAPTMETLIAARFLQAFGACSGPVIARAVVRDLYGPAEAQRVMAGMSAALALAPALSPTLGGAIQAGLGWRAIFLLLTIIAAALLALVAWGLDETHRGNRLPLRAGPIAASYRRLLFDPRYMAFAGAVMAMFGGMFAFITGAPFLFIDQLGISPQAYGFVVLVNPASYVVGTLASRRLGARWGSGGLILAGGLVSTAGGVALLVEALTGTISAPAVLAATGCYQIGLGLLVPAAMAGAIAAYPQIAGTASALLGFLQMAASAFCSLLVSAFNDTSQLAMMTVICVAAAASAAIGAALYRR